MGEGGGGGKLWADILTLYINSPRETKGSTLFVTGFCTVHDTYVLN